MASSKIASKSKPGIGKQEKQKLPASTVKKAATRSSATTAKKSSSPKKRSNTANKNIGGKIPPEERHRMIEVAAYYRAEKRGFECKCNEHDWFDAAAEIDSIL